VTIKEIAFKGAPALSAEALACSHALEHAYENEHAYKHRTLAQFLIKNRAAEVI